MSPRKLLLLTAVVLVLFGFIVLFERRMPSTSERQEKGDLVWDLPSERIEGLRLERGGSLVELKKVDAAGNWRLVKPEAYPADAGAVNEVVSQLARPRRVGSEAAEAKPDDYGFRSPSARATILWRPEKEPKKQLFRTLELGIDIPGTDSTAARQAGTERIVFVSSSLAAAIKKSENDFKSKDVFVGSSADAARLDVDRGRGRLSLSRKNGFWWLAQPLADLADADAVQRLVGDLTGLKVLEFLAAPERQDLASLGLAPPLYRVTLADAKGAATTADFGATRSDGNSVYGRRETQVFTVGSAIVEELSKETEAFREPRLVRFDRAQVSAVSVSFGAVRYAFDRQPSGWLCAGKPVSASAADDLLTAIGDLKSRSFVDESETGGKGREPEATLTVKGPGTDWTIRLFAFRGEGRAMVDGRPGAFALAIDPTSSLQASCQKAAVPQAPIPTKGPGPKKP